MPSLTTLARSTKYLILCTATLERQIAAGRGHVSSSGSGSLNWHLRHEDCPPATRYQVPSTKHSRPKAGC